MKIRFFLMLLVIGLMGAQNDAESAEAEMYLGKTISIEYPHQIPSFSIVPPAHTSNLNIFISPTCNYCERLFLDVIDAYKRKDNFFSSVRATFTLMPRSQLDVQLISGFMCLGGILRPKAIYKYYKQISDENGTSSINSAIARKAYLNTLASLGVSDEKRLACERDKKNQTVAAQIYRIGDSVRQKNMMPIVLYKDRYIDLERYKNLHRNIFSAVTSEME